MVSLTKAERKKFPLYHQRLQKQAAQKKRALMKEIDKREDAEKKARSQTLTPFDGVDAMRALRKASKQNEAGDFKNSKSGDDLVSRLESTYDGTDRDITNIKKYGDAAMRSRAFGSRQPSKKMGGGKMKKPAATKKMNMGGKCRGMGATTRGGNFKIV
mgnify:CR=1 FL=1